VRCVDFGVVESEENAMPMKSLRHLAIAVTVFCGMLGLPQVSQAQMTWYPPVGTWSGPTQLNNQLIMDSLNQNNEQKLENSQDKRKISVITDLNYVPSKTRTRTNLKNFANKTRAVDPAGAAQMEQFFASTDIIGLMGTAIAPYGLRIDNVADAFAVYWINAWEAANGVVGAQETRARVQAVKVQAANGLSQSPEFASASDAQKQEMAEALLVQAALISSAMEAAANDPAKLRAISNAVMQGAAKSGLDLNKMTLTEKGFVPIIATNAKVGRKR
jgi:hypothetical protein